MAGHVEWHRVGDVQVVSVLKASRNNINFKNAPQGYEEHDELGVAAVPVEVREFAARAGLNYVGRLGEFFIAGPNKAARMKAAWAGANRLDVSRPIPVSQPVRSPVPCVSVSNEDSHLRIDATEYVQGGVDPHLLLDEIEMSLQEINWMGNRVSLRLAGLWHDREPVERCLTVLRGFLSSHELNGVSWRFSDIDLSNNDLYDEFLDGFITVICNMPVDNLILDDNLITTQGALDFVNAISNVAHVSIRHNPVEDPDSVVQAARNHRGHRGRQSVDVGPEWNVSNGRAAVTSKKEWCKYFRGPAQLVRLQIMQMPELAEVRCPVPGCPTPLILSDRKNAMPIYTAATSIATHLTGDKHRKALQRAIQSNQCLLSIPPLPALDLLSGNRVTDAFEQRCVLEASESDVESIRSLVVNGDRMRVDQSLHRLRMSLPGSHAPLGEPMDAPHENVECTVLRYSQTSCGGKFRGGPYAGQPLQVVIDGLMSGEVLPLEHEWMTLDVVQKDGRLISVDNRRLYCLHEHQRQIPETSVLARIRIHRWYPVFDRFLRRDGNFRDIRIRSRTGNSSSRFASGGPCCWVSQSLLRTPDGLCVPVENIRDGGQIQAADGDTLRVVNRTVHRNTTATFVALYTVRGWHVFPGSHAVETPNGMINAEDLMEGDVIAVKDGDDVVPAVLCDVDKWEGCTDLYDLQFHPDKPVESCVRPAQVILSRGCQQALPLPDRWTRRTRRPHQNRRDQAAAERRERLQAAPQTDSDL